MFYPDMYACPLSLYLSDPCDVDMYSIYIYMHIGVYIHRHICVRTRRTPCAPARHRRTTSLYDIAAPWLPLKAASRPAWLPALTLGDPDTPNISSAPTIGIIYYVACYFTGKGEQYR